MSEVKVVFEPSDELQLTLAQFVRPEMRKQFHARLLSDQVTRLPVTGGDVNGLKHSRSRGQSGKEQSATDWLHEYHIAIKSLGNHVIPLANAYPKVETLQNGNMAFELPLAADRQTLEKIGHTALREVSFNVGESVARKNILKGHLVIPYSRLADHSAQTDAMEKLLEKLHAEINSTYEPSPQDNRMYVTRPFVSDQLMR